jgi:hypothetical protein
MLEELGRLAEAGRLKNFTELAEAVARVDETVEQVDDTAALKRVARLLDSIFDQAYRGERTMAYLADRVNSVAEVLDLMAMEEPGGEGKAKDEAREEDTNAETEPPAPAWDTMWENPSPCASKSVSATAVRKSAGASKRNATAAVATCPGGAATGSCAGRWAGGCCGWPRPRC